MKRVVLGPRAVVEALHADAKRVQVVYVSKDAGASARKAADEAAALHAHVEQKPSQALDRLAKGLRHQGVLALTGDYGYYSLEGLLERAPPPAMLVLCDGIEDPQNLGAILRACVFFGASGIVIPRHRASPVTAAAVRASAGASEHARVARVTNLADAVASLSSRGFSTVALVPDAPDSLGRMDLSGPLGLIVGSEHAGVRPLVRRRAGAVARLAGTGDVASLNAAAATAVALYEVTRQREAST